MKGAEAGYQSVTCLLDDSVLPAVLYFLEEEFWLELSPLKRSALKTTLDLVAVAVF